MGTSVAVRRSEGVGIVGDALVIEPALALRAVLRLFRAARADLIVWSRYRADIFSNVPPRKASSTLMRSICRFESFEEA